MDRYDSLALAASLLLPVPAFATGDCVNDAFEPNDCATPYVLGPGNYPGLVASTTDFDFYKVTIAPGDRLTFEVDLDAPMILSFQDALTTQDCFNDPMIFQKWLGTLDQQIFHWSNFSSAPQDFLIGLVTIEECAHYDLTISMAPDPCMGVTDNGIQGNHDCASAANLANGDHFGQFVRLGEGDFYRIAVQPAELKSLDVFVPEGSFGSLLNVELDQDCAPPMTPQFIFSFIPNGRRYFLFNSTSQTQLYTIEVSVNPDPRDPTTFCVDYDLEMSSEFDPLGIFTGDQFEPNDACLAPSPIDDGRFDLTCAMLNQDWYSISVEPGATLSYLVSPDGSANWTTHLRTDCTNSGPSYLALGQPDFAGSPNTRLTWKNEGTSAVDANFFVIHPFNSVEFASRYELDLRNTQGEVFCDSTTNSTGDAARIDAAGSTDVNGNGIFQLSAVNLPANAFGLFFFSENEVVPVPFGNGLRCLGGPFRRLHVTNAGSEGVLQTAISWSNPGTASVITPGSTWSFQAWYRDAAGGGAQYDLSDGLRVEF